MANLVQHQKRHHRSMKHTHATKRSQASFLAANHFRRSLNEPSPLSALPNNVLSVIGRGLTGKKGSVKQQYLSAARNLLRNFEGQRGGTRKKLRGA